MYYDAYNAVDRNTTTCMRTADIGIYNPHNNYKYGHSGIQI